MAARYAVSFTQGRFKNGFLRADGAASFLYSFFIISLASAKLYQHKGALANGNGIGL